MTLVEVTKRMLIDLWNDFHEDEDMPEWDALTPQEKSAAWRAVVAAHCDIDELHPMVDAVQALREQGGYKSWL